MKTTNSNPMKTNKADKEAYRMLRPGGQLSICVVNLKNGYGYDIVTERDKLTMPGWDIGFELERNYPSGFIVQKPASPKQEVEK